MTHFCLKFQQIRFSSFGEIVFIIEFYYMQVAATRLRKFILSATLKLEMHIHTTFQLHSSFGCRDLVIRLYSHKINMGTAEASGVEPRCRRKKSIGLKPCHGYAQLIYEIS